MAEYAGVGGQRYRKRVCCASFFFAVSVQKHGQMKTDAPCCRHNGAEKKIGKKRQKSKKKKKTDREKERFAENRCTVYDNSVPANSQPPNLLRSAPATTRTLLELASRRKVMTCTEEKGFFLTYEQFYFSHGRAKRP